MPRTAYYWDESSLGHDTGRHVECIERAERLRPEKILRPENFLRPEGSGQGGQVPEVRPIAPHGAAEWVLRVHEPEHHDFVASAHDRGFRSLDRGDTRISGGSYEAALNAVDAALTAADEVMVGKFANAFCAMRPPGHHALPFQSMGFCLFATISILARYLQERHGLRRIAIVDWDVHHGNGTQHVFWEDPEVLFVSLHQHPLYPGSGREDERGEGKGVGATLNLTISPGTEEEAYLGRFGAEAIPAVAAHRPDFILISAGFDAHYGDPLGGLRLTPEGFARLTRMLREAAGESCGGRIVSLLEGGYNLDALASSAAAHLKALAED